ncbi:MAG: [protein-PII] uridylyltransferase [Propionibacteriales bacterium]|nr:[protein-PII] uridylyltransferase [Propionibacteriales bacterium]
MSSQGFVVRREQRADAADARLRELLEGADAPPGLALVAVGGYGRRELSPYSDLDVVLLHADGVDPAQVAEQVWYPLWDDGIDLDHAVRTLDQMRDAAAADLRTALGLLDARHVAGDPSITLQARSLLLADWRASARERLPELARQGAERAERSGDLAHAAVPHLKESRGGLRDAVVLRGLVATWLVDVPHAEVERCRTELLAVRDALHTAAGRGGDRLLPELTADVGALLAVDDVDRHVRSLGRRIAYLSQLTWRRVDHVRVRPSTRRRTPDLRPLTDGVAVSGGKIVLDRRARPERDPLLLLRAAVAAAETDRPLAPASAVRLARTSAPLRMPWPAEARRLLVRLLGAGPGLVGAWDALEQSGAVDLLLPEWEGVTLLRSTSAVHRFTVDRHLVETCVEASRLLHRVRRPDLLLVAALLHDIGKGRAGDHCAVGATMALGIARRWGYDEADATLVARVVREHLLLPETATRRDLQDPATGRLVADEAGDTETLELLAALTEADARATGPAAWTSWRARLVSQLLSVARATLTTGDAGLAARRHADDVWPMPPGDGSVVVQAERHLDGTVVQVGAPDRLGLLSDVSAALALAGLEILSARAATVDGAAWSRWLVAAEDVDVRRVRQLLLAIFDGGLEVRARLVPPAGSRPTVTVEHHASESATVVEVRDRDWRGLVSAVCAALVATGVDVRSAHVETLGPQAVDVFYVCDEDGRPLTADRAAAVADLVRAALVPPRR